MTKLYVVWNCYDCYNVYTSLEKAAKAADILKRRMELPDDYHVRIITGFNELDSNLFIFVVEEGEAFGVELHSDHSDQDVIYSE